MRVAPAALVAGDHAAADEVARATASVTHAHALGQDGAAVQAAAVHHALHGADDPLDRQAFLEALVDAARTVEFRRALELVDTLDPSVQPQHIAALLGNGIQALHSVPAAVAAFLTSTDSPGTAILTAVRCGGDADTIAAMTGAISGARCGERALEPRWLERLEGADRIRRLGSSLAKAAVAPAGPGAGPGG